MTVDVCPEADAARREARHAAAFGERRLSSFHPGLRFAPRLAYDPAPLRGSKGSGIHSSTAKRLNSFTAQRLSGSTAQRLNGSTVLKLDSQNQLDLPGRLVERRQGREAGVTASSSEQGAAKRLRPKH